MLRRTCSIVATVEGEKGQVVGAFLLKMSRSSIRVAEAGCVCKWSRCEEMSGGESGTWPG